MSNTIKIVSDGHRTSTLQLGGLGIDPKHIEVIGVLEHGAQIALATQADAQALADWLLDEYGVLGESS